MRSSGRARDSCPSSCSTSPSWSPGDGTEVTGGGKSGVRSFLPRRLMWQRKKLFGRADDGAKDDLWPKSLSRSMPVSPESTPMVREGRSDRWWPTAIPQPLPLPGKAALRLTEEGSGSEFERRYNNTHTGSKSPKPSTYCRRGFPEELRLDSQNLRINLPARSAPGSCLPTPPVSPRKSVHQESSASKSEVSPIFRGLSDSEIPGAALPRFTSHVCPDSAVKSGHYPDHSPLSSPSTSRSHPNPSSPNGISSSFYHKSLSEGQWNKGKLIGHGSFGSVYVATNRETGALCAMKEVDLVADDPRSAESVRQLEQEIRFLRRLNHPNIVQYYGSETIEDHFYIYLEYVYPGSISKYVQEHFETMTESVVRNFTRHILSGLAYLHSKSIIHRDIKGANLLVDSMGVVKLADFGMAKHLSGQVSVLSLKGSPYWLAPELLQGAVTSKTNPDIARAVDIWSVGCTVIEMVNGKPPWGELEGPRAMFKVLNGSPPIPDKLSPEGKDFLNLCFRRNPAERPSASTLLQHPFLRNSNDQQVSVNKQTFPEFNFTDKSRSLNT
ncbi:hypothetical protein MLD38_002077 [Melastoma candidum]|uniref:Uncharacterized protein n=1 Tax=Melastoma candidum TaxID=119954 RepID=A0ACB9SFE3_9MYRT|nr:hypothetical protein MLD38_002077 [Melastoma candidum]